MCRDVRRGGRRELFEIAEQRVAEDVIASARAPGRPASWLWSRRDQIDKFVRRRHGQLTQDEPLEDGKDRRVDSDTERKREHGDRRHQRPSCQRAGGVADVLPEGVEHDYLGPTAASAPRASAGQGRRTYVGGPDGPPYECMGTDSSTTRPSNR